MEPTAVTLARIDERTKAMAEVVDEMRGLLSKQNGRVSSLERWRAYQTGAIAVLSMVAMFVLSVLAGKL